MIERVGVPESPIFTERIKPSSMIKTGGLYIIKIVNLGLIEISLTTILHMDTLSLHAQYLLHTMMNSIKIIKK